MKTVTKTFQVIVKKGRGVRRYLYIDAPNREEAAKTAEITAGPGFVAQVVYDPDDGEH